MRTINPGAGGGIIATNGNTVNLGTSQTLAALNSDADGVVTLDSALAAPAPEFGEADPSATQLGT